MPVPVSLTVNVIVLRAEQVLLTKREDFEVWCLPGGHVDPGESVASAAVREAKEETGYDVVLDGLVGVYSAIGDWPDMHACAFSANLLTEDQGPIGTPDEIADLGWFDVDALPEATMWWHVERIGDAVSGRRGVVAAQHITSRLGRLDRDALYTARDRSSRSRLEFFENNFPPPG